MTEQSPDQAAAAGDKLHERDCRPVPKGAAHLDAADVSTLARHVPGWTISGDARRISRRFTMADFDKAYAFVQDLVALARAQDHHPDISFGWGFCEVFLTTHSAGGLSDNDFIIAVRIDRIAGS